MGRIAQGLLVLGVSGCISAATFLPPAAAQPLDRTPTPEATPTDGTRYTVRPGDSLWVLSQRFGVPMKELAERNGIGNARRLRVGAEIVVPSPSPTEAEARDIRPHVHVVRPGDSLYSIAGLYAVRPEDLRAANPIADPRRLQLGQRLHIPIEANRDPASRPPSREEMRPDIGIERADAILAVMKDDYLRADFERVLERAPELGQLLDSLPEHRKVSEQRARAAFVAGASLAALGRREEALASFEHAYEANPDLVLDKTLVSPSLSELLDAARDRGSERRRSRKSKNSDS